MDLDELPRHSGASYDGSDSSGTPDDVGGGSTWWVIGLRDWGHALTFCSNHFSPSKKRLGGVACARDTMKVTEYGANSIPCQSSVNTHTLTMSLGCLEQVGTTIRRS